MNHDDPYHSSTDGTLTRRSMLRHSAAAAGAAFTGGALFPSAVSAADGDAGAVLKEGTTILFQGDSITDAGRKRPGNEANNAQALGWGYPLAVAAYLLSTRPEARS